MFEIIYKIINKDYEQDIKGTEGFFQIRCNEKMYGEFYSAEIEKFMDTVEISRWMNWFLQIVYDLRSKNYILLSDIESYNTWIEFKRKDDIVLVSIISADKPQGSTAIEYEHMPNTTYPDWNNEEISYYQFECEVIKKAKKYLKELNLLNTSNNAVSKEICNWINKLGVNKEVNK